MSSSDFNDLGAGCMIERLHEENRRAERFSRGLYAITLLSIGAAIGMTAFGVMRSCEKMPEPVAAKLDCAGCHRQMAMTEYLKKSGSRNPEAMAYALINHSRSPRLLAAISVTETGGNTHDRNGKPLRNAGYKKRHHGAFQVNPKYWGSVGESAIEQTKQAQAILDELTQEMPIKKALSVYGGDSSSAYQKRVLAELVRVP